MDAISFWHRADGRGLTLRIWGVFKHKTLTMFIAILGKEIGITTMSLMLSNALRGAIALMGLIGLVSPFANCSLGALLQAMVQPEMQGHFFPEMGSLMTATVPFGLMLAGPVVDEFCIQVLYQVSGLVCLLVGTGRLVIGAVDTLDDQIPSGKSLLKSALSVPSYVKPEV